VICVPEEVEKAAPDIVSRSHKEQLSNARPSDKREQHFGRSIFSRNAQLAPKRGGA
jgi:hypothetical protein